MIQKIKTIVVVIVFPCEQRSRGETKIIRKRETSAGARCVFYHPCTGVLLTTSNVLVTCDTTYRTGLRDNSCGLKNFQRAVLTGHAHSILSETDFENW